MPMKGRRVLKRIQIMSNAENKKINIFDLDEKALCHFVKEKLGAPAFRGKQIFGWMYGSARDFSDMTNLPKDLREKLAEVATLGGLQMITKQESRKDGTRKYLFGLSDGNSIESVFMKYKYGNSICISSQAGCRMGCKFCASTLAGLSRNLTPGEIIQQIVMAQQDTGEKINHVVVMGTGEPFDNYENLSAFLRLIAEKDGLNIGMRNITVSTCGIVPKILEFAKDFPQVNLAISLHAASDSERSKTMPINHRYGLQELMAACREYIKLTNRRITFEYALIQGVNDGKSDAAQLSDLLSGMLCHVNLIPLNKVSETGLSGSSRKHGEEFKELLAMRGINATVRRELGSDIDAACGQLRLKNSDNQKN